MFQSICEKVPSFTCGPRLLCWRPRASRPSIDSPYEQNRRSHHWCLIVSESISTKRHWMLWWCVHQYNAVAIGCHVYLIELWLRKYFGIAGMTCLFVWCLTARQHRIGQFVPTAGGWKRLRWLRMANERHIHHLLYIFFNHSVTAIVRITITVNCFKYSSVVEMNLAPSLTG